jgi:hypothetical protein
MTTSVAEKILDEVHAIREKLSAQTKQLTDVEHTAFFNKAAEDFCRKKNLRFRSAKS